MTEIMLDGRRYEMRVEGAADVEPGPLSRFIALAADIEAEGGEVPPELADVLARLQLPRLPNLEETPQ